MSACLVKSNRANNGVGSEERTTPASNLSEESTNLERNKEDNVCEDNKIVAVNIHPVAASISNPIEESRRIRGHQNASFTRFFFVAY